METTMHDYVVAQLQAMKGRWPQLAEETGISRRTIEKIARREIEDPSVSFIERLNKHFRKQS